MLAIRVLVAGAELASEPITAGCFEYCDFHQAGGRWLLGLGIVGEILAVAIALGSRLATLPAIAIIVGSLAVVGIGFSQGIRGDPWTGIVVVVLALEALLLTGAFWSSFSER